MTYDEILKACIERAPDDGALQRALCDIVCDAVGAGTRAFNINSKGARAQVAALKKAGFAAERILIEIAERFAISVHALGERVRSPMVPVPPKKKKKKTKPAPVLKRVRFVYEVLCPVDDTEVEKMGLADIQMACEQGDCSGHFIETTTRLLTLRQAKLACEEHDTDLDFFEIPEFEIGTRVWWTDPDDDASSGWYTIVDFYGETYQLKNEAGGECEALEHELSITKPKEEE